MSFKMTNIFIKTAFGFDFANSSNERNHEMNHDRSMTGKRRERIDISALCFSESPMYPRGLSSMQSSESNGETPLSFLKTSHGMPSEGFAHAAYPEEKKEQNKSLCPGMTTSD